MMSASAVPRLPMLLELYLRSPLFCLRASTININVTQGFTESKRKYLIVVILCGLLLGVAFGGL
jgi:hypothetical protein